MYVADSTIHTPGLGLACSLSILVGSVDPICFPLIKSFDELWNVRAVLYQRQGETTGGGGGFGSE